MKEAAAYDRLSLRAFYVRRFFRILTPLSAFLLFVGACASWIPLSLTVGEIARQLTFVTNYDFLFPSRTSDYLFALLPPLVPLESRSSSICSGLPYCCSDIERAALSPSRSSLLSPLIRVASFYLMPWARESLSALTHMRADGLMFGCFSALTLEWQGAGDGRAKAPGADPASFGLSWPCSFSL